MTDPILVGIGVTANSISNAAQARFSSIQVTDPLAVIPAVDRDSSLELEINGMLSGLSPADEDSGLQLLVYSQRASTAVLETSNDLTHWTELTRFNPSEVPFDFEEELQAVRFYRARLLLP
jgi:hypothetical protein